MPPYERQINTVFQRYALFPHLDVYDNIAFGLKVAKLPKAEIQERVHEMLGIVGLKGYENRRVDSLSGGQQQRVAIARALAKNPKLLLCDEPTGALDYQTGKAILQLLQDTGRKTGMTVIIITHNSALTAMADRVIRVKNGTVVSQEVNEQPRLVSEIEW